MSRSYLAYRRWSSRARFGALVPARSPEETAQAIQAALDSPETSRRMAAEGQVTVLKRYSVARLLGDMAALYRELLAQNSG